MSKLQSPTLACSFVHLVWDLQARCGVEIQGYVLSQRPGVSPGTMTTEALLLEPLLCTAVTSDGLPELRVPLCFRSEGPS